MSFGALLYRALGMAYTDRGHALEDYWSLILPEMTKTLGDLEPYERRGKCPSLIFSPMLVEDGWQLLISNLDLLRLTHTGRRVPIMVHLNTL